MLIKTTNFCSMGCSHCMEDSTVKGEHMTEETFMKALACTRRIETLAWRAGCPPRILLSGGEVSEHPQFVRFVEIVIEQKMIPVLITNGMWLGDEALRKAVLRPEWKYLTVQVTNDTRFYPQAPPVVDDPRIVYVDALTVLLPLGRAQRKGFKTDLKSRHGPSSFNLRSLTRSFRSIEKAVATLRARAALGMSGNCTPSICDNGDIMAGETRNCFKIGTVDSSNDELTKAFCEMRCNKCGLVDALAPAEKRAIGESFLFMSNE